MNRRTTNPISETIVKAEATYFKERALAAEVYDRYIQACRNYRQLLAEEMRRSPIGDPSSKGYIQKAEASNERLAEAAEELEAARADFDIIYPEMAKRDPSRR